jgi:hypothetical protein
MDKNDKQAFDLSLSDRGVMRKVPREEKKIRKVNIQFVLSGSIWKYWAYDSSSNSSWSNHRKLF